MTVAVLGPGAVGGSLAVKLARAGERVVCLARPDTAARIARDGLSLVQDGVEVRARPAAATILAEPVDLLLVTVKAPFLAEALERVVAAPGLVVPLLNGLEHMAVLRRRFAAVTAATIGRLEAWRDGPTRIVQRAAALVRLAGNTVPEPLAHAVPLALLTAATGRPVGELRGDPRLRAAVAEACTVAAANGAATTFADQWRIVESLPADLTTSTARDVAAGRPSELDAIAGAVVRAGRPLGVPTPVFEELLAACPA